MHVSSVTRTALAKGTFSNILEYTRERNLLHVSSVTSALLGKETFNNITEYIQERSPLGAHNVGSVSAMRSLSTFIKENTMIPICRVMKLKLILKVAALLFLNSHKL